MEIPDDDELISEDILATYRKDSVLYATTVSLDTKALGVIVLVLMFLIFLILILWDHYQHDIRTLYFRNPVIKGTV